MKRLMMWLTGLLAAACWASAGEPFPVVGDISPAKYEVLVERDQTAPMRDGVRLKIDVYRPKAEGRFPAIVHQTPYDKSGGAPRANKFAARGYVVVNVDSRGRFDSQGDWDPFSPLHKTDGHDMVEWVARQPWCTGKVGTFGLSYMGWQQWWTASQSPPSLKAIVPEVAPPDNFYNCPYQNGVFVCWMIDWAGLMSGRRPHSAGPGPYGGFAVGREEAYRRLPYIDFDQTRKHLPTAWWRKWMLQNTSEGEYWRAIAYQTPESYAKVRVPSLAASGWFDANFPGTPANYLGMKKHGGTPEARRPRMVVGPWEHIINTQRVAAGFDFGPRALIDWDGYVCRWFDHYLKGIDNRVTADPPVHVFVMGRNEWRSASDWPLPEAVPTKFYLHSGGRANSSKGDGTLGTSPPGAEQPDNYTYDPNNPTPSPPFANGHIDGPRDVSPSAARGDVLVYTTPVLQDDVEVIGPISARLYAATSGRDTDWMVRLVDVHPDGRALFLAEGLMRARHRDARDGTFRPDRLSTLEPGRVYLYTIDFYRPTGNLFLKGHRIRVEVSSSYYPYYLRNLNTGDDNLALATKPVAARQTILHDAEHPSHVVLPVIPAAAPKPPATVSAPKTGPLASSFPLGVYWPWERTDGLAKRNGLTKWAFVERCLDRLKADGFDAVWAVNLGIDDLPDLAQRIASRKMSLVPGLAELHYNVDWRRNNWTYLEKASKSALAAAGDSPGVLAWALCDEPGANIVGEMETFRRKFVDWGAKQPAVVVTMWPDSPIYAEKTGFGAVCTDVYPFFSAGNPNGPNAPAASRAWYRRHAQIAAQSAQKAGRTPWIMPQCFVEIWGPWKYDQRHESVMLPGAVLHWRQPSLGETRWQVWAALGTGVRGFFWYVYLPPTVDQPEAKPYVGPAFPPALAVKQATPLGAPGGMLRPDGSATSEYRAAAEAFAALRPLVPLLKDVAPADSALGEVSSPGWIGGLVNPALKRSFAVVVNDDTDREQTLTIRLKKPCNVRDLRTGQNLPPCPGNTVSIKLAPGDGTLLEEQP